LAHFRSVARRHITKRMRHEPCRTRDKENIMPTSKKAPHQAEPESHEDVERHVERYRAQMRRQGTDDAVFEREASTPRNVDVEQAHRVADEDWETGETDRGEIT
jgi:hypothetical protein